MTDSNLKRRYQQYLDDFDPSPQYAGDDYSAPLDFDNWCDWQEQAYESAADDGDLMSYTNSEVI